MPYPLIEASVELPAAPNGVLEWDSNLCLSHTCREPGADETYTAFPKCRCCSCYVLQLSKYCTWKQYSRYSAVPCIQPSCWQYMLVLDAIPARDALSV